MSEADREGKLLEPAARVSGEAQARILRARIRHLNKSETLS
ncbi:MAG: hypothetical protein Q7U73_16180 [Rubrivivax sp.]|nr:hypothetical protein [Rubrivivax sp.]